MKRVQFTRLGAIAIAFGLLIPGFQNCSQPASSGYSSPKPQLSGNGDGYSGKTDLFRRYDPQMPCPQVGRDGKSLPNEQIFYQMTTLGGLKEPYVVRENCADIAPKPAPEAKPDITGNLVFQGRTLAGYQRNNDFQVLAAQCPAGKTPIPNAARTNLIVNSQDWTEQPVYQGWMWHSGMAALLNGSIMSLPAYQIVRTDAAFPEEWRRISQVKRLESNTQYSFSFIAKTGTRDVINVRYYRLDDATGNEEYIIVDFNLNAGTYKIRLNDHLPPAQVTMVPVGDGYFCTVHFTTSAKANEWYSDLGFGPTALNGATRVGDSVYATAAQLEKTSGFCQ